MNNLKKAAAVMAMTMGLGFSAVASATTYTPADNSIESELCATAATATKMQMHRQVAKFTTNIVTSKNYQIVADKLYCNGTNVVEFARQAGNDDVADKLESYRGNYVQIREIAEQRLNGSVRIGSK